MFRTAALFGALAIVFPLSAKSDIAEETLGFSQSYRECFTIRDSESDRLSCYDAILPQLADLMERASSDIGPKCQIEDWNYEGMAQKTVIRGAATCASGRLDFRLYDGDEFLTAGTTFVRGFAFETIASVWPIPKAMQIKYVIESE